MSKLCKNSLLVIAFLVSGALALGQSTKTHVEVADVPAKTEDVSTLDGVMKAFYEVISGPAGQPRQWSRDRSLYVPGVRFVVMSEDKSGKPKSSIITHQQFVDSSNESLVSRGFFETEIHRITEKFGNIAHIFSTYETREKMDGPSTGRGINSVQLYFDGTRWWVTSVAWDDERPDNPLPKQYLP